MGSARPIKYQIEGVLVDSRISTQWVAWLHGGEEVGDCHMGF